MTNDDKDSSMGKVVQRYIQQLKSHRDVMKQINSLTNSHLSRISHFHQRSEYMCATMPFDYDAIVFELQLVAEYAFKDILYRVERSRFDIDHHITFMDRFYKLRMRWNTLSGRPIPDTLLEPLMLRVKHCPPHFEAPCISAVLRTVAWYDAQFKNDCKFLNLLAKQCRDDKRTCFVPLLVRFMKGNNTYDLYQMDFTIIIDSVVDDLIAVARRGVPSLDVTAHSHIISTLLGNGSLDEKREQQLCARLVSLIVHESPEAALHRNVRREVIGSLIKVDEVQGYPESNWEPIWNRWKEGFNLHTLPFFYPMIAEACSSKYMADFESLFRKAFDDETMDPEQIVAVIMEQIQRLTLDVPPRGHVGKDTVKRISDWSDDVRDTLKTLRGVIMATDPLRADLYVDRFVEQSNLEMTDKYRAALRDVFCLFASNADNTMSMKDLNRHVAAFNLSSRLDLDELKGIFGKDEGLSFEGFCRFHRDHHYTQSWDMLETLQYLPTLTLCDAEATPIRKRVAEDKAYEAMFHLLTDSRDLPELDSNDIRWLFQRLATLPKPDTLWTDLRALEKPLHRILRWKWNKRRCHSSVISDKEVHRLFVIYVLSRDEQWRRRFLEKGGLNYVMHILFVFALNGIVDRHELEYELENGYRYRFVPDMPEEGDSTYDRVWHTVNNQQQYHLQRAYIAGILHNLDGQRADTSHLWVERVLSMVDGMGNFVTKSMKRHFCMCRTRDTVIHSICTNAHVTESGRICIVDQLPRHAVAVQTLPLIMGYIRSECDSSLFIPHDIGKKIALFF